MPFDTTQLRTTTGVLLQTLVQMLGLNCSTENVNGDYNNNVRGRSADDSHFISIWQCRTDLRQLFTLSCL